MLRQLIIQEMQLGVHIQLESVVKEWHRDVGFLIDHMSSERYAAALKSEKKSFSTS